MTEITGYRKLTEVEIDLINQVKAQAEAVATLITQTAEFLEQRDKDEANTQNINPMRWLNEGRTDLQKGFMCITRAIAKPQSF